MATATSMLSNITREMIQPYIDYVTLETSQFCGELMKTSGGVWRDPQTGRDWKVIRNFALGVGGAVEMAPIAGPDIADVGSAVGYNVLQKVQTWPGLGEATQPAYLQRELTLKKLLVTMYIPLTVIKLAQMRACIGDQFGMTIKATARNVAYHRCNNFLGSTTNTLGTFTSGTSESISSTGLQVTLNAGSSIRRFTNGQRVDIFLNTGPGYVRKNSYPIFVGNVDAFGTSASPVTSGGGTLKLYHVGAATTALANATDYDIVPRNSGREFGSSTHATMKTSCLDDYLKDSGTVQGVDVDNVTEIKSMVRTLSGAPLSGGKLLEYVSHYLHARGGLDGIDSLWAQAGVWAAYFNSLNSEFTIERNGALVEVKDGVRQGASFSLGGYSLPFRTDSWLPEKTVYGLKTRGNWTLIVPPKYPGSKSHPAFDGAIEFVWPMMNDGNGIFGGYRKVGGADAGAFTDILEAPGEHFFEITPEKIPGLKLTEVGHLYG